MSIFSDWKHGAISDEEFEAWDEVMKDVQDWQDDFNTHVKLLALTDAEKEATMMYGEDVVNMHGICVSHAGISLLLLEISILCGGIAILIVLISRKHTTH